jgi:diguanylate cyclase (GGDEF)-like protein
LRKHRVLIVDDDPHITQVLTTVLEKAGYEPFNTPDSADVIEKALNESPDLIILDIEPPGGEKACLTEEIRLKPMLYQIPIILLTNRCSEEERIMALDRGIDDVFCKPFSPKELLAKVKAILRQSTRSRDSNPTTHLPGGNALEEEIRSRLRQGRCFALLHVDIDNFKAYADSYGFNSANKMIRLSGKILGNAVEAAGDRSTFLSHIGGDDFIIVTSNDRYQELAEKIMELFDEQVSGCFRKEDAARRFYVSTDRKGEKKEFPVTTVSIGIISNESREFSDPSEMGTFLVQAKNRAKQKEGKAKTKSTYFFLDTPQQK